MKDKTFQIKLSHLIIGGILLLLIIFLIFFRTTPTPINTYDKEKKEIDSLQNETNKLKNINVELGNKIYLQENLSKIKGLANYIYENYSEELMKQWWANCGN